MAVTPAQAVAAVDSPRHDWDELADHYKAHCKAMAAAAVAAHLVLEAAVPLAPPEYMPPAPSFLPERDGTLGEVEPGDRFIWAGRWREAGSVVDHADGASWVGIEPDDYAFHNSDHSVRIQKRAAADDTTGPPPAMRLPGGDVAYQTIRAAEVVPGMWVFANEQWRQLDEMQPSPATNRVMFRFVDGYDDGCDFDTKVKVASTVDGARLAAERQAQQAEAYDRACEART